MLVNAVGILYALESSVYFGLGIVFLLAKFNYKFLVCCDFNSFCRFVKRNFCIEDFLFHGIDKVGFGYAGFVGPADWHKFGKKRHSVVLYKMLVEVVVLYKSARKNHLRNYNNRYQQIDGRNASEEH